MVDKKRLIIGLPAPSNYYECSNEDCRLCYYNTDYYTDESGYTRCHTRDKFRRLARIK